MKIHLLSGFLGSGKTTAIRTAARVLGRAGLKTGVITNDQGARLVDGGYLAAAGIPGRQVMNGCFCCNFSDLDGQIESLRKSDDSDVVFAESVGSCTDIVATVYRPMLRFHPGIPVTLSVVCDGLLLKMLLIEQRPLFAPEVAYIYWKQIEEASLVLINKTDLLTGEEQVKLAAALRKKAGGKEILFLQADNSVSVQQWLAVLDGDDRPPDALSSIDYDLYASGEAMMARLDEDILISSGNGSAGSVAQTFLRKTESALRNEGCAIGHIKWLIDGKEKLSQTATSDLPEFPTMAESGEIRLLLNARVQMHPDALAAIVDRCIGETRAQTGAVFSVSNHSAFQPGYPRPEHRMI